MGFLKTYCKPNLHRVSWLSTGQTSDWKHEHWFSPSWYSDVSQITEPDHYHYRWWQTPILTWNSHSKRTRPYVAVPCNYNNPYLIHYQQHIGVTPIIKLMTDDCSSERKQNLWQNTPMLRSITSTNKEIPTTSSFKSHLIITANQPLPSTTLPMISPICHQSFHKVKSKITCRILAGINYTSREHWSYYFRLSTKCPSVVTSPVLSRRPTRNPGHIPGTSPSSSSCFHCTASTRDCWPRMIMRGYLHSWLSSWA